MTASQFRNRRGHFRVFRTHLRRNQKGGRICLKGEQLRPYETQMALLREQQRSCEGSMSREFQASVMRAPACRFEGREVWFMLPAEEQSTWWREDQIELDLGFGAALR